MIVCDRNKLDGKRCNGAPDFIIEIVSPGNPADDYIRKLYYYKNAGVREYWIVDPHRKTVTVNHFEKNLLNLQYSFDSVIKVNIYDDLLIDFAAISRTLVSFHSKTTRNFSDTRSKNAKSASISWSVPTVIRR